MSKRNKFILIVISCNVVGIVAVVAVQLPNWSEWAKQSLEAQIDKTTFSMHEIETVVDVKSGQVITSNMVQEKTVDAVCVDVYMDKTLVVGRKAICDIKAHVPVMDSFLTDGELPKVRPVYP